MQIIVNDLPIDLPGSLGDISLSKRIEFDVLYGNSFTARMIEISRMKDEDDQMIERIQLQYDKVLAVFSFFTDIPQSAFSSSPEIVDTISAIYFGSILPKIFESIPDEDLKHSFAWHGEKWELPKIELEHGDPMKFGELIDAKQIVKDLSRSGAGRWEIIQFIAAIYFRHPGELYSGSFLYPGSDRLKIMEDLPLDIAMQIGYFFDLHNEYLSNTFPVFGKSRSKSGGPNSTKHFDMWGWVNFLKSIAKTKIFDIPGSNQNSIDNVRDASCFDVLVYASEEKELYEAQALDHEIESKKH